MLPIASVADGIVVISSHLEKKFRNLTSEIFTIHRLPISVDIDLYHETYQQLGAPITLFYAGSFAMKDGLPVLLSAFDKLAAKRKNVQLVLTGRGSDEAMRMVHERIRASAYKSRIIYKGYLDDAAYYGVLDAADIPCMTRIDMGFAQAGFPFKLGEFLATDKPVIASSVSDISALLKDREEIMLVPPGSSDAIVEATEFLMNDQDNAFAIGDRSRAAAHRMFDYRAQSRALFVFWDGLRDFFENGQLGFITDSLEPEAFAELIAKLIANPDLRSSICYYNREYAKKHFSSEVVAKRIEIIYRRVA